jgi:ABC-2 type transport system permease protein
MRKSWIVARHEFLVTIKRVWFVVSTFIFPLFFLGIGLAVLLLTKETVEQAQERVTQRPLGIVDQWGGIQSDPEGFSILRYSDEEKALKALQEKKIDTFIVLKKDYLETGLVEVRTTHKPSIMAENRSLTPPGLKPWILENILAGIEDEKVTRAKNPLLLQQIFLEKDGSVSSRNLEEALKRSLMGYAFFFLLFLSIFTASGYLLQGMADEKENRVMEIVLSSITPNELMLGKLVGLGAAGLLQLAIWVSMGVVGILFFAVQIVLDPFSFVYCFVFFLLGYVLFGSLMLGFGALGTNFRESQQMASLWGFIGSAPMFAQIVLVEDPHGTVARVFSYIPFTAPVTMMLRYTIDPKGMPWYEVPAVISILLVSIFLALRLSAKLYRVGLLLYGKRPSVREILKWVFSPAN